MKANDVCFLKNFNIMMERVQISQPDPQMSSGALIHVPHYLGNLLFRVWKKMQETVQHTPLTLDPNTADSSLTLSTDLTSDDTFELHSVQVELEAVEKQIRQLLERQAELRAALESSRDALFPDVLTSGAGTPRTMTTSPPPPPPVFEISTRNRFAPLRETERDAVIVGDSIVRYLQS
ncbi:hypothetical protein Q8A67_013231 [Cirrhinus molitorella]|uniref:Uncharacterized protein n=1 Tax=Cirrhinus molitorella TaxID=172907 RepID=A0AA88PLD7_9TELE|nr:hypothetical protein Q8A67_013231 [Cirrhinus molitorella]